MIAYGYSDFLVILIGLSTVAVSVATGSAETFAMGVCIFGIGVVGFWADWD